MTNYACGYVAGIKKALQFVEDCDGDIDYLIFLLEKALAQQPQVEPKRECGTCWHERSSALMVSEPCRSCVDYNNHEPKEGA